MAELSGAIKGFVVTALARFMTPTEVVEAVKEEFGTTLSRQQVRHYNPEQSSDLAPQWRELFEAERKRFTVDISSLAASHWSFRLRELEMLYRTAKQYGNTVGAAQLLEQMAREVGGHYTNRRELTGAGGAPMALQIVPEDTDYRKAAAALAALPEEPAAEGSC